MGVAVYLFSYRCKAPIKICTKSERLPFTPKHYACKDWQGPVIKYLNWCSHNCTAALGSGDEALVNRLQLCTPVLSMYINPSHF